MFLASVVSDFGEPRPHAGDRAVLTRWLAFDDVAQEVRAATRLQDRREGVDSLLWQLRAEAANPKTDIWWGGTGDPYYQAAEIGLLDAYRPAYINDLHGWAVRQYAMSQNYVGGFYTSAIGFGYNEELSLIHISEPTRPY